MLTRFAAKELQHWQQEKKQQHIMRVCWQKQFAKIWDSEYQANALKPVTEDTTGKYFTAVEGGGRADAENARKVTGSKGGGSGGGGSGSGGSGDGGSGGGGGGDGGDKRGVGLKGAALRPKDVVGRRIENFAYEDRVYAYAIVFQYYKTMDRFQLKLYAKADDKRCTKGGSVSAEHLKKLHFPDLVTGTKGKRKANPNPNTQHHGKEIQV
jgi:hypothetical protein